MLPIQYCLKCKSVLYLWERRKRMLTAFAIEKSSTAALKNQERINKLYFDLSRETEIMKNSFSN